MTTKILVVGDTIVDEFVKGDVSRINPEAKWSVVLDQKSVIQEIGGAGNVAANISTLSPKSEVYYLGYLSHSANVLLRDYRVKPVTKGLILEDDMLVKTRFAADNHVIVRVDKNKDYKKLINSKHERDLMDGVGNLTNPDIVVISDYAKGTLSNQLLDLIVTKFSNSLFFFDLKIAKNISIFRKIKNLCIIKCNSLEFEALDNIGFWSSLRAESEIFKNLVLIKTLGADGYSIVENEQMHKYAAVNKEDIVDVVGCGDVFLAGMVTKAAAQRDFRKVNVFSWAHVGNVCSYLKVKKFGTAKVSNEELESFLDKDWAETFTSFRDGPDDR